MSLQSSRALPSVGETFGACYIGSIIAAILFGVTNLQAVLYYKRHPDDWWIYRYSVALLWLLDTLHVASSTYALYVILIDFFGDLTGALQFNLWSMKSQLSLNDFLVVYVQGLHAIRLWKLGRHFHKILPSFVSLAVVASLGATIFVVYNIHITPNLASASNMKLSICIFFSTVAIADLIIALPMTYYLHKSRGHIIFSSAASVLLRLMRLVLISGLATR
ncbi:hypothetical protein ARMGADRAFT_1169772 [Armillaria gallica]|uniref:Uncharacterized protein n=1 Tax=Armillaria gallica TaxID=47427 RepID=A0A2H3D0Q7_ARMGA|nr:hypothetical protein ARMGADRAFT_1169772 [Armillaria gallica]